MLEYYTLRDLLPLSSSVIYAFPVRHDMTSCQKPKFKIIH